MAEFMAQAHEKRLEAMEQVKAEVQRGYEQQIADLQSKVRSTAVSCGAAGLARGRSCSCTAILACLRRRAVVSFLPRNLEL